MSDVRIPKLPPTRPPALSTASVRSEAEADARKDGEDGEEVDRHLWVERELRLQE